MPIFTQEKIPTSFQKKTCWLALTGVSGTIVVALVIAFFWIAAIILGYLQQVLLPIAIAGIIAYLLEPVVSYLEKKRINRTASVVIVLGLFLCVATFVLFTIIPPIVKQTNEIIENREENFKNASKFLDDVLQHPLAIKAVDHYYENSLEHKLQADEKTKPFLSGIIGEVIGHNTDKADDNKSEIQGAYLFGDEKIPIVDRKITELFGVSAMEMPEKVSLLVSPSRENTAPGVDPPEENPQETATEEIDSTSETKRKLFEAFDNNSAAYGKVLWRWFSSGREIISGGIAWIIGAFLIPIFVFVFLKESKTIALRWTDILPIRTSKFKQEVVETLTEINGYLIAFFRGQMIVSLIDGFLIGLALYFIMGMPSSYSFLIGVAVGILGIIPYVGIFSVYIPTLIYSWAHWHDWQHPLGVTLIFLICNQFDSWVIQPKIVGNAVGLHEVTVIFSVIFWSYVFGGIVGALLAVPLTASVKVIFQRYVWMNFKARQPVPAR